MNIISLLVVALLLSGCVAIQVTPGAERVRLSNSEPGKECTFLGEATVTQGDFRGGHYTSDADLETGTQNDLRNKAAAMGGNYVTNLTSRGGHTGSLASDHQTNVTIAGNVYHCPE
jgi:hypothetical protein